MENNSAQKCGVTPKWRFELYDQDTGELVFAGTDAECSEFAGASLTSAISKAYRNTRNATYHNYRIVDVTPPELAGDKPLVNGTAEAIRKWDEFCEPIRAEFGIPVYRAGKEVWR